MRQLRPFGADHSCEGIVTCEISETVVPDLLEIEPRDGAVVLTRRVVHEVNSASDVVAVDVCNCQQVDSRRCPPRRKRG
jgi:hypothetical protein